MTHNYYNSFTFAAANNKTNSTQGNNCKTQCYTVQFGNSKCEIICSPPVIEQPTQSPYTGYMQQSQYMQYPGQAQMPCTAPNCPPSPAFGAQVPSQAAYPAPVQYGSQVPAVAPQWPSPSGCTGSLCDQANRKSEQEKETEKEDEKEEEEEKEDDNKETASDSQQGSSSQVPVVSQVCG